MKKSFAVSLVTVLAFCATQLSGAEPNKKTNEANKLAREGADAAKNQDWNKAIESLRKAADMDHKYSDELSHHWGHFEASASPRMSEFTVRRIMKSPNWSPTPLGEQVLDYYRIAGEFAETDTLTSGRD